MRLDPGMMQPMSNTQISDQWAAPFSFAVLNGVSIFLPLNYNQRFFSADGMWQSGSLKFQLNVTRFGIPTPMYNPPVGIIHTPEHTQALKKMLETYRNHIRPMLPEAKVYHHTPELRYEEPGCFGVLELGAADKRTSLIAAFTMSEVLEPVHYLRFRGLSHCNTYDVWEDDEYLGRFAGKELIDTGLRTEIPGSLDSRSYLAVAVPED